MIDTNITIYSSDNTKSEAPLILKYRARDTSTSLVLHGDSAFNYGQDLLTNLVWLTENFCNNTAPLNPVQGQKFYNSDTKTLSVFDEVWNDIVIKENVESLDIVFEREITSPHSSYLLANFTDNLLPLSGNTVPVSITLDGNKPTEDNHAVTKKYVDSVLRVPVPYLPRDGYSEMTGPLVLADTLRSEDDNTLVNVKYVDELGEIDLNVENKFPDQYRVTSFVETNKVLDDGTTDVSPFFVTAWFHTKILDAASEAVITLPVSFIDATDKASPLIPNYLYSYAVNCTSVDSNVKLHVTIIDGSSFKVKRGGTTGDLKVCGTVYGYRAR